MAKQIIDSDPGIRIVKCDTAEDLLSEFRPETGFLWKLKYCVQSWIFRGQANADWDLTPSALRRSTSESNPCASFNPWQSALPIDDWQMQMNAEQGLMFDFCAQADAHGYELPGDHPQLRDLDSTQSPTHPADFPPVEHRGMYALAQHYGIPTRFLDWTLSPRVAAYFAIKSVAEMRTRCVGKSPEYVAVWAVNRNYIDEYLRLENPGAVVVTVPTVSNPNLHAQKGLFTLVRYRTGAPNIFFDPDHSYSISSLDNLVKTHSKKLGASNIPSPVMVKFELCAKEARTLLRLLDLDGINATTMFPNLHSVVLGMKEKWFHQVAEIGSRS